MLGCSSVYELFEAGLVFFACTVSYCFSYGGMFWGPVQYTKSAVCMVVSLKIAHWRFDLLTYTPASHFSGKY